MAERVVKMTPSQKFIAKKMRETIVANPQAATGFDVDMGPLLKYKEALEEKGQKVTVTALLVKALAVALQKSPSLNSRFVNDQIYEYDEINAGVAMSTSKGLIVPVIKNTESKSAFEISQEIKGLREQFENNKMTPDNLTGGTVTISSIGGGRNDMIYPILNNNECILVGAGRTRKVPAVMNDGTVGVKDICHINIMNNHCITYGVPIGIFCTDYAEIIENPELYLK